MNEDASKPPVSSFAGPIAELVGHGMLSPPSRPGLLATLDDFEVVRILGGGGMGVVLLARDVKSGAQAAIKMIRPELLSDQQIVHRFLKEAGHLQRLKHKNIIEVSAVQDREQGPYFVMPYFEQGSLAKRIRPGEPLETGLILDIAAQICEALQFAHRRGIIHRDLKPANILLTADRKACLADFGLARTVFNDTIIDVDNQQCEGTAPYMSPGVAAGNAEDTRCDIYGFGALLYEMLTGDPPYKGRTTKEIREQILAKAPPAILELSPKADRGLVTIAEAATARELRDRYADIGDVLADLNRVKDGKSPFGTHGGLRGNLEKARNPRTVVWMLLALAAIGGAIWALSRAKTATVTTNTVVLASNAVAPPATPVSSVTPTVPSNNAEAMIQTNPPVPPAPAPIVAKVTSPPPGAFERIHDMLAPYGTWLEIAPYGQCWRPTAALTDHQWRPYTEMGHWVYTDSGWFWRSDYSWGQITFHYGRWFQNEGRWVWMPGYDWAPAWVCWREAEGYLGWAPLPPDAKFQAGAGLIWDGKAAMNSDFGLGAEAFTFVTNDHFWDHNLRDALATGDRADGIFKNSVVKNGYRMEQGKFIVEGPGRDHIATVTQHDIKVESGVVWDVKTLTGN